MYTVSVLVANFCYFFSVWHHFKLVEADPSLRVRYTLLAAGSLYLAKLVTLRLCILFHSVEVASVDVLYV